ncbi:VPLPA-CTERM sorting domain-containing protein [Tateyamaria sp.]|uniref:VPLPA-CTERM sorting domain-containing protein n=1 Tax=Tateyamaria sp. TaxID=1929288 RepID=UPI00329E1372
MHRIILPTIFPSLFLFGEDLMNVFKSAVLAAALILGGAAASAATFTTNTYDNGWYRNDGIHGPTNTNIITGVSGSFSFRSFFAFNLASAVGQTVTSAKISFFGANGSFVSPLGTETLGLFDVGTSAASIVNGTAGTAGYSDLGSGNSYGTHIYSAPSGTLMQAFSVSLTSAALTDINSLLSGSNYDFLIGSHLLTVGSTAERLWSGSGFLPAASLTLETTPPVPLPAGLPLLLAGLGAFGIAARRKRKAA